MSLFEKTLFKTEFIGLDHFKNLFTDSFFLMALENTIYFAVIIVPISVIVPLVFAAMLRNLHKHSKSFFRLVFYLPVVTTSIVLVFVWIWMYDMNFGIINYFLGLFGIEPINFFGTQFTALLSTSNVVITWMIGQPLILYMAGVDNVPEELYESAKIDGANFLQIFFKITVPMVINTTLLIVVTSTIAVFQIFVVIYLMTHGGPYHGTDTLVFSIYNTAFETGPYFGQAAAESVVLFVLIAIVALIEFRLLKSKLD
ncbi:carbohydrate ABC transporter permease [Virgibacillus ihumii]|uniref:carbohydrate ABC transporter permease n=1 Tax=Virgibacillus ihumii TaxID=2686091 RepID=UPI00157BDDF7|nr:sugar ABC transporter permease [Virgibacillus ihumii]